MILPCPNIHEKNAWNEKKIIAGIDEAGRGPLCGPVVIGAVILPINTAPDFLADSKKITEKQRLKAFEWITKHCLYTTVIISPREIDTYNIYQSTIRGMRQAYIQLNQIAQRAGRGPISHLVIDAMPLKIEKPSLTITPIIKGESASSSIAAASIVAKVIRDQITCDLETMFPYFSLSKHKGYGTAQHQTELALHGQSIMHRKSFVLKSKKTSL
ncbi:ribonuclease HII [Candidatus Dependentiae bacterium]|nr:ribonuclease HII [Candidatus Dependentiae bacterium]